MSFDFEFDSSAVFNATDLEKELKKYNISSPNSILSQLVDIGGQFSKSATDVALAVTDLCLVQNQHYLNDAIIKEYKRGLQLDHTADLDIEFIPADYNRELDIATTRANIRATHDIGMKSSAQPLQPSPNSSTIDQSSTSFSDPSTTSPFKASKPRSTTPSHTAGTTRSQWTPLLSSPSSAFPEHHQKGQVLVRYAPAVAPKITTKSVTTMFDDVEHDAQIASTSSSNPTSEPRTVPIYVVSWIHHALYQRRKGTSNIPQLPLDQLVREVDPLKPIKPFRYMNWNHMTAVDLATTHEEDMAQLLLDSPAIHNELSAKSSPTPSKPTTITTPSSTIIPAHTVEEDDDIHQSHNFQQQQIKDIWYVGHIKNIIESKDKRLTASTVVLSNFNTEASLRLTHKDIQHYSLFPGQIIACRGTNITGSVIIPDLLITETLLQTYQRKRWLQIYYQLAYAAQKNQLKSQLDQLRLSLTQSGSTTNAAPTKFSLFGAPSAKDGSTMSDEPSPTVKLSDQLHNQQLEKLEKQFNSIPSLEQLSVTIESRPVQVMYCNGPYVSSRGTTQAISAILEQIQNGMNSIPDVLILSGPFVDMDAQHLKTTHTNTLIHNKPDFYGAPTSLPSSSKMSDENPTPTTSTSTPSSTTTNQPTPQTTSPSDPISLCNVPVYKTDALAHFNKTQSQVSRYQDLFQETLDHIIAQLNADHNTQHITVITVPSPRDLHHYACYPQPGYNYLYTPQNPSQINSVRVYNAPNPCLLDINGTVFGVSTNDAFAELSKHELFMQSTCQPEPFGTPSATPNSSTMSNTPSTPSKNDLVQLSTCSPANISTPGNTNANGAKMHLREKRTVRLLTHFLSQQSFSPISTTPNNITLQNSQARTTSELIFKPDLLLLPSKVRHFIEAVPTPGHLSSMRPIQDPPADYIKEHGHVLAVNPNSVIAGEQLGTFAQITVYAPNSAASADIADRVRAEIIHL